MASRYSRLGLVLCLLLSSSGAPALAEEEAEEAVLVGRASYERHCATCHGPDARGAGEFASLLRVPPPDLTAIAKRRSGVFEADEIARIIDGRSRARAHGSAEMPIWGERLGAGGEKDESEVAGEIALLVAYLRSIQVGVEPAPSRETEKRDRTVAQVGQEQFRKNCAACHGSSGRGDGYLAEMLQEAPADLRSLSRRNGGKFPSRRVAAAIDGREKVLAHGSRDMPIWGERFRRPGGMGGDAAARGEIMLYVAYIRSIQESEESP